MRFHNSPEMERFAERAHFTWAGVSLASALLALCTFYQLFPAAMFALGLNGKFYFAQLILQGSLVIFGLGGAIFHLLGGLDHRENLRKLARMKVIKD